jgi:Type II restriction endonuclease, TdeIII
VKGGSHRALGRLSPTKVRDTLFAFGGGNTLEELYSSIIAAEFEGCINGTITRLDNEETHRPFHAALLSQEALFWSRFERSFSTSFGQRVIEQISKVAALAGGATAAMNQKVTTVRLTSGRLAAIENHIGNLRGRCLGRAPAWALDIADVRGGGDEGSLVDVRVISDLWWVKDGINHYMSIKTVKPNIDQTAEAKRDLLKLQLNDPDCRVYFGLYYNPYGEKREDYVWSPPKGVFDFRNDSVVLIGKDFWDTLGGIGFYEEVLTIANECGTRTRVLVGELNQ